MFHSILYYNFNSLFHYNNVINQFNRLNIRARKFSAIDAENNEIVNMEFNKKNTTKII